MDALARVAACRLPHLRSGVLQRWASLQQCRTITMANSPKRQDHKEETITITPRITLFDETVHVKVKDLPKREPITLHLSTEQEWRQEPALFVSYSHHVSNKDGVVDLDLNVSLGGTYSGLDPMGLFWSMQASHEGPSNPRMVVSNVEDPLLYKLSVYKGHLSLEEIAKAEEERKALQTGTITRLKKKGTVKRVPVREGKLRGVLFLPEWGVGSHPGVIDLPPAVGGAMEGRAALMASRGFATLALPYFRYQDLPKKMEHVDFTYFTEAATWLSNHKSVKKGGIGVVGTGKGAEFALIMGWRCSEVAAVVQINGPPFYTDTDLKANGKTLLKGVPFHLDLAKITNDGMNIRHCFPHTHDHIIPVWEGHANVLTIVSDDDEQNEPTFEREMYNMFPDKKRKLMKVVHYPGAGHLLEPPYTPFCRCCYNPALNVDMVWGGCLKEHMKAQKDAWKKTLRFLAKHLPSV